MLEFFEPNCNMGNASIYENHITFSKNLIDYFKDMYRVRVGIEKDEKKIYIFLLNKDYALSGEVNENSLLPISISKTYARVCSRALISYIANAFNLTINKKEYIRYSAEYDSSKRAIVIKLEEEK